MAELTATVRNKRPVALPKPTKEEKWAKAVLRTDGQIDHLCNLVFHGSGTVVTTIQVNDEGDISMESKDLYEIKDV